MQTSVGKAFLKVTHDNLATVMKTGSVNVLSTSVLLGLMEQAACKALEEVFDERTTISYKTDLSHKRPSALGAKVTAVARVKKTSKDLVEFEIEAFDETGLIGTATHIRKFISQDEFEENCYKTAINAKKI
ncbi:dihydrolipoamide acyltransferase [Histomonas meleagridis]|uniref:dihydrolipoamide acyltransferase n=1 Tax=Histomonas meleagridis TaxID=135588 RepID=UPI00355A1D8A|nr:dihydrolipoamide acyltransferase [Histomonas meleagridis]KAH0800107.1 dihydrolipoamide acyltransferase [Histomonas meleagridis]